MRRLVVLAIVSVGCTYPDFRFAPGDSAIVDDTAVGDTSVAVDSSIDTFAADTFTPDTFVADSAKDSPADITPDAPVSTGCSGVMAKHCFDWDTAAKPEDGWTYSAVDASGSIALDPTGGRSLPNAFLATTAPGVGEVVTANLTQVITTAANDTVVKLDAWIKLEADKFPGTDGAFLLKLQRNGGDGDGVTFSMGSTGFYVDRIALSYEYYEITTYKPKIGTWMHVRLHTKLHTTAGSVTLWIDNMSSPLLSKTAISTVKVDSTAKQAIVGLYAQGSTGTFKARYDDVTIDY